MGSEISLFFQTWVSLLFLVDKIFWNIHRAWIFGHFPFVNFSTNVILSSSFLMNRNFWANPVVELSYLYEIKTRTDQVKSVYEEYIQNWPSNSLLSEDDSFFS
jgi:hypothetical protein